MDERVHEKHSLLLGMHKIMKLGIGWLGYQAPSTAALLNTNEPL